MTDLIEAILTHGRAVGDFTDKDNHFTPRQVEQLRRYLRQEYVNGNRCVTGSWRKGYEMILGDERIGVTNGHGSFKIYYHKVQPYFLPKRKIPMTAFTSDDGNSWGG